MIPKRIYLYHGGPLSWLRYLTIESLSVLNPDYEILLFTDDDIGCVEWESGEQQCICMSDTEDICTDDWRNYIKLNNVTIKSSSEYLSDELLTYHPVHKSDIIRWMLLSEGGIWSDDDIIYLKPIDQALNQDADIYSYYIDEHGHTIGLLAGSSSNTLWKDMADNILLHTSKDYQGYGVDYLRKYGASYGQLQSYCRNRGDSIHNFPYHTIFLETIHAKRMYQQPLPKQYIRHTLLDKLTGLHWFGGHPYNNIQHIYTEQNYNNYDNLITKTINKYRSI